METLREREAYRLGMGITAGFWFLPLPIVQ